MHQIISDAAEGRMPAWTVVSAKRAAHIDRVRVLLGQWADATALDDDDRIRWRAAGSLHDALHDAPHDELRESVPQVFRDLPGKMLHGPACAERLRTEGVNDLALLHAITYHTMGHPELGDIGLALYAADFLEPGRPEEPMPRSALRTRMPSEVHTIVPIILQARLIEQIRTGKRIRPETLAFWNSIADERRP